MYNVENRGSLPKAPHNKGADMRFVFQIILVLFFSFVFIGCSKSDNSSDYATIYNKSGRGFYAYMASSAPSEVPVSAALTIHFSEQLDASTVTTSTILLKEDANVSVPASVVLDNSNTPTVVLRPLNFLKMGKNYTLVITTDVKNVDGDSLAQEYTYSFSTTAADTTPPKIRTGLPDALNADPNTAIAVEFDELLDTSKLTSSSLVLKDANGNLVSSTLGYKDRWIWLYPTSPLASDANYTVSMADIYDLSGNAYADASTFNFRTASSALTSDGYGKVASDYTSTMQSYSLQVLKNDKLVVGGLEEAYRFSTRDGSGNPQITLLGSQSYSGVGKLYDAAAFLQTTPCGAYDHIVFAAEKGLLIVDENTLAKESFLSLAHPAYGVDLVCDEASNKILAFVATSDGGVSVVDINTSNAPALLGQIPTGNLEFGIKVGASKIYTASFDKGVGVYEINGTKVQQVDTNSTARSLEIIGNDLIVSNGVGGVSLFTINSDGTLSNERKTQSLTTVVKTFSTNDTIFAATTMRGVSIIDKATGALTQQIPFDKRIAQIDGDGSYLYVLSNEGTISMYNLVSTTVSGTAIDGYLQGAFVYKDCNGNLQYDPGTDINTTTDANGTFIFHSLPQNCRDSQTVVEGGVDADTNETFKGELVAPAGAKNVTPVTTLVATNPNLDTTQLLTTLGLASIDEDFVKTSKTEAKKLALSLSNTLNVAVTAIQDETVAKELSRSIFSKFATLVESNASVISTPSQELSQVAYDALSETASQHNMFVEIDQNGFTQSLSAMVDGIYQNPDDANSLHTYISDAKNSMSSAVGVYDHNSTYYGVDFVIDQNLTLERNVSVAYAKVIVGEGVTLDLAGFDINVEHGQVQLLQNAHVVSSSGSININNSTGGSLTIGGGNPVQTPTPPPAELRLDPTTVVDLNTSIFKLIQTEIVVPGALEITKSTDYTPTFAPFSVKGDLIVDPNVSFGTSSLFVEGNLTNDGNLSAYETIMVTGSITGSGAATPTPLAIARLTFATPSNRLVGDIIITNLSTDTNLTVPAPDSPVIVPQNDTLSITATLNQNPPENLYYNFADGIWYENKNEKTDGWSASFAQDANISFDTIRYFSTPLPTAEIANSLGGAFQGAIAMTGTYEQAKKIVLSSDGTRAYVAWHDYLRVIDFTSVYPTIVGAYLSSNNALDDVVLSPDGTIAYVVDGDIGIDILDIRTSNPSFVGNYDTNGTAQGIALSPDGKKAYVANGLQGIKVLDVTPIPFAPPTLLGSYQTSYNAHCITLSPDGTKAFVGEGNYITALDITTDTPSLLGSYTTPNTVSDITLSADGTTAYVANTSNGVLELNVSDATNISLIDRYDTTGAIANGVTLSKDGSRVYASVYGEGVVVLDIVNGTFQPVKTYHSANKAYDVALSPDGTKAYVANFTNGAFILDISSDVEPTIGVFDRSGASNVGNIALTPDGLQAYVVIDNNLVDLNLTSPTPTEIGFYLNQNNILDFELSNDGAKAYVADGSQTLSVLDITDGANISKIGDYNASNYITKIDLSPDGTKAYTSNFAVSSDELLALDINTSSPTLLGSYSGFGSIADITVLSDGQKALIADDASSYITMFNIQNDTNITAIKNLNTISSVYSVSPDNKKLYVIDSNITVFDLTANPVLKIAEAVVSLGTLTPQDSAISPDGKKLYFLATNILGLQWLCIYDITPETPVMIDFYALAHNADHLALSPDGTKVYVAQDGVGIVAIDVTKINPHIYLTKDFGTYDLEFHFNTKSGKDLNITFDINDTSIVTTGFGSMLLTPNDYADNNFTIPIQSVSGKTGTVLASVHASDGNITTTRSYYIVVEDKRVPPKITAGETTFPLQVDANTTSTVGFGVSDVDSNLSDLSFSILSTNEAVIPTNSISYDFNATSGTLLITFATNAGTGYGGISVDATDGSGVQSHFGFVVHTVEPSLEFLNFKQIDYDMFFEDKNVINSCKIGNNIYLDMNDTTGTSFEVLNLTNLFLIDENITESDILNTSGIQSFLCTVPYPHRLYTTTTDNNISELGGTFSLVNYNGFAAFSDNGSDIYSYDTATLSLDKNGTQLLDMSSQKAGVGNLFVDTVNNYFLLETTDANGNYLESFDLLQGSLVSTINTNGDRILYNDSGTVAFLVNDTNLSIVDIDTSNSGSLTLTPNALAFTSQKIADAVTGLNTLYLLLQGSDGNSTISFYTIDTATSPTTLTLLKSYTTKLKTIPRSLYYDYTNDLLFFHYYAPFDNGGYFVNENMFHGIYPYSGNAVPLEMQALHQPTDTSGSFSIIPHGLPSDLFDINVSIVSGDLNITQITQGFSQISDGTKTDILYDIDAASSGDAVVSVKVSNGYETKTYNVQITKMVQ